MAVLGRYTLYLPKSATAADVQPSYVLCFLKHHPPVEIVSNTDDYRQGGTFLPRRGPVRNPASVYRHIYIYVIEVQRVTLADIDSPSDLDCRPAPDPCGDVVGTRGIYGIPLLGIQSSLFLSLRGKAPKAQLTNYKLSLIHAIQTSFIEDLGHLSF